MTKEEYWYRVDKDLSKVDDLERGNRVARDLRGRPTLRFASDRSIWETDISHILSRLVTAALNMARGKLDEANRLFELILSEEPNHLMALTGRVSCFLDSLS